MAELGKSAALTLSRLGYANVTARIGDGYQGWEEHAPYDAIVVTAARNHVPPALRATLSRFPAPDGDPAGNKGSDRQALVESVDPLRNGGEPWPIPMVR